MVSWPFLTSVQSNPVMTQSHGDMSERMTWSPGFNPSTTSMVLTEARPSFTDTREASLSIGREPEQADRARRLPEGRPAYIDDVVQMLQFDGAVHAQVRPGPQRQRALELHVHGDVPSRTDGSMRDTVPGDHAVARVHLHLLPDLHVLGLCLGDLQLGLELLAAEPPWPGSCRRPTRCPTCTDTS